MVHDLLFLGMSREAEHSFLTMHGMALPAVAADTIRNRNMLVLRYPIGEIAPHGPSTSSPRDEIVRGFVGRSLSRCARLVSLDGPGRKSVRKT